MRIAISAIFRGQEHTGSGQYLHQLVSHLERLATPDDLLLLSPTWVGGSPQVSANSHSLRTPFDYLNRDFAKLWFEQVTFPMACRQWGVDLAHVPYFAPPLHPTVPTLVTVHDLIPLLLPAYRGSIRAKLYARLVARGARQAVIVLTDSHASCQDVITYLHVPSDRVRVVYLAAGAAYRPVPEGPQRESLREKHHLPLAYLLYLGGFDHRKNVVAVLSAFARMRTKWESHAGGTEPWLVVAGRLPRVDARTTPDPLRVARELGVANRVVFTGWVPEEDKPALYSGACAFVFPSYYEGFGLPPLEAMACGTPVIASNTASLPEVVGPGGVLISPDDVIGLSQAMASLWDNNRLRQELSVRAQHHAAQFSWTRAAQETLAAYREVSEVGGRSSS